MSSLKEKMVSARSQVGIRYMGKLFRTSCLTGYELKPSIAKNTAENEESQNDDLVFDSNTNVRSS